MTQAERLSKTINNLTTEVCKVVNTGVDVVDVFSIILAKDNTIHIHSSVKVDPDYIAAIISLLDVAFDTMLQARAKTFETRPSNNF